MKPDDDIRRAREKWRFRGQTRPAFASEPEAGQESVWDYPRPPRVVKDDRHVRVLVGETSIADTEQAVRVLETASAPAFYLPPEDVDKEHLTEGSGGSSCEWKGSARYWSVRVGDKVLENVGWSYPDPLPGFEMIRGYLSFYPSRLVCIVGDEQAHSQPGGFYGGWVTSDVRGPFKGAPGTEWW